MEFAFNVANSSGSTLKFAILAGVFNTRGITLTEGTPNTVAYHNHRVTELAARFTDVNAVIDDGTVVSGLVCTAQDSRFTISHFREWLAARTAPLYLKRIVIEGSSTSVYTTGKLTLRVDNPMEDKGDQVYSLSKYFDTNQFQETAISIPMVSSKPGYENGTRIAQESMMFMTIPTGTNATITLEF